MTRTSSSPTADCESTLFRKEESYDMLKISSLPMNLFCWIKLKNEWQNTRSAEMYVSYTRVQCTIIDFVPMIQELKRHRSGRSSTNGLPSDTVLGTSHHLRRTWKSYRWWHTHRNYHRIVLNVWWFRIDGRNVYNRKDKKRQLMKIIKQLIILP